jgi:hypothetical protein
VRPVIIVTALLLAACTPAPPPVPATRPDPVTEAWYGETIHALIALNRDALRLFRNGKLDESAALITKGESLSNRLLGAPRPTLAAMEAASDLDELYGRMLIANHNVGWARLQFQKNLVRWRNWKPQSDNTARRLKQAQSAIRECDRLLAQ